VAQIMDWRQSEKIPSSLKERQEILDDEVAGHVNHATDNHQDGGEPYPQWSRLSRLHRWSPQPDHIQARTGN
jgi:N-acetyl-anhydromuramyl-L-alanine amidase AmpD